MNKQKGFTIIELIVVIAIIAVLAGIVLVNVTSYINKGKDAAIQGNLSGLRTNAAVYYDVSTNTQTGAAFILSSNAIAAIAAINAAKASSATPFGDSTQQSWCVRAVTFNSGTLCADNTGYVGVVGSAKCATTSFTCQ